jgi:hypothetical protein
MMIIVFEKSQVLRIGNYLPFTITTYFVNIGRKADGCFAIDLYCPEGNNYKDNSSYFRYILINKTNLD